MKDDSAENLDLILSPDAYFHELITSALGNQKLKVEPQVEFYLVHLLNRFITTDNLYSRDASGHMKEEPLAMQLKEAIEEPQKDAQRVLFRQTGDVSLYLSGFFQESLTRKLVDVDYYINLGKQAYKGVAVREAEKDRQAIFEELAGRFSSFVDVLAEVSEKTTTTKSEQDLLRLYEVWSNTGSARAEKVLLEAGIDPNQVGKKKQ